MCVRAVKGFATLLHMSSVRRSYWGADSLGEERRLVGQAGQDERHQEQSVVAVEGGVSPHRHGRLLEEKTNKVCHRRAQTATFSFNYLKNKNAAEKVRRRNVSVPA